MKNNNLILNSVLCGIIVSFIFLTVYMLLETKVSSPQNNNIDYSIQEDNSDDLYE